jgi:hypothetical protein
MRTLILVLPSSLSFYFEGFAVLSANLWHEHADGRANMEGRLAAERARVVAFQKSNPGFSVVCRPCYNDLFELLNDLSYAKVELGKVF